MAISLTLLQIVGLASSSITGGSLNKQQYGEIADLANSSFTMFDDYNFFYNETVDDNTTIPASSYGAFYLTVLFDYCDRALNDYVLAESNDIVSMVSTFDEPHDGCLMVYADDANIGTKYAFMQSFLNTALITYDPSQNYAEMPVQDDGFWFYAIEAFLNSRGFTYGDTGSGDYSIRYIREYCIMYFDEDGVLNGSVTGEPYSFLCDAVDDGVPAIFTARNNTSYDPEYPFFCLGYSDNHILGYNPHEGLALLTYYQIAKACVLDFHTLHHRSNNVYLSSNGFAYCACGQRTCYQVHDYHYQWVNNRMHRKTCDVCGDTRLEMHQGGNYCICLLQD